MGLVLHSATEGYYGTYTVPCARCSVYYCLVTALQTMLMLVRGEDLDWQEHIGPSQMDTAQ